MGGRSQETRGGTWIMLLPLILGVGLVLNDDAKLLAVFLFSWIFFFFFCVGVGYQEKGGSSQEW